jgi:Fe(3+) dicitrate transport protein
MKSLVFVCLIIITATFQYTYSQGTFSGNILQTDSSALSGAHVFILETKQGTTTNTKGAFSFSSLPKGIYTVEVSAIGYAKQQLSINILTGTAIQLTIVLQEVVTDLPMFSINGASITGGTLGVKDLPGSAYYVSPKEIEKFNHTDINRTLRTIPGVNIQEEEGFGLRPNIGLRGTSVDRNSKITVMEDGILIAPAPYASPAAYYFPSAGRMQGIEVVKGSSQIKYGPFTTGGAINLLSSTIPNDLSAKVRISGGSFGFRTVHANVGASFKNFGYLVETFQYGAEGFKQLPNNANTGFDKQDYMVKLRLNTDADAKVYQSLTLKLLKVNEISNETYLGISEADFALNPLQRYAGSQVDKITTEQRMASLTHYIKINKAIDITTVGYYTDFGRNWYKLNNMRDTNSAGSSVSLNTLLDLPQSYPHLYAMLRGDTNSHNSAFNVRANNRFYYSKGIQSALGARFMTGNVGHRIDAGVRYHYDNMDRFQWDDRYRMTNGVMLQTTVGIPGTESNRIEDALAFSTFIQYGLKYKKLTANVGLRYENIEMKGLDFGKNNVVRDMSDTLLVEKNNNVYALIPGVYVDYKFIPSFSAFIGVHKGFAPPGNTPETKPESSINYEVGIKYNDQHHLASNVVFFYNDYQNILGTDLQAGGGAGTADLFNIGTAQVYGAEVNVIYDPLAQFTAKQSLPITLAYTFTNAFFTSDFNNSAFGDWGVVASGDFMPYIAPHQLSVGVSYQYKKMGINLSSKYMAAMRTEAGQGELISSQSTDSYFISDINLNYIFNKNVSVFSGVNNILNESYVVALRPAGLRPGMPRMFTLGVKANF